MKIPQTIEKRINAEEPIYSVEVCKSWRKLKNMDNVYYNMPLPYELERRRYGLKSVLNHFDIDNGDLSNQLNFYYRVGSIYDNYDFILTPDFYGRDLHPTDITMCEVTPRSKKDLNIICKRLKREINKS